MAELTIDKVYAKALYQVAQEMKIEEKVVAQAKEIGAIMKREPELKRFMDSPIISVAEKKQVLGNIFQDQICEELMNFLFVLVDKGRTRHFEKILARLIRISMEEEGVSAGVLYSTQLLTNEQMKGFEAQTGKLLRKKVHLENQVDSSLLGGVKILIEGKIIDASFRKQLDSFRDALN